MSEANVLGQRKYRGRIDTGLAARINKEVAEEERLKSRKARDGQAGDKLVAEPVNPADTASIVNVDSDFITLENIVCVDAAGKVIEKYDRLDVRKDIERQSNNSQVSFTPYNATVHFESKGLFLPSFALSCNILAALYANKSDAEVAKVLSRYKDKGNGYGWHAQNTLVNWGTKQVIHYPNKSDYTSAGGTADINKQRQRKQLIFDNNGFKDVTLNKALKDSNYKMFLQNLTGLSNPEVLVDIGKYFGMAATRTWVSSDKDTRAAWLGCYNNSFDLDTYDNLDIYYAARGVRSVSKDDADHEDDEARMRNPGIIRVTRSMDRDGWETVWPRPEGYTRRRRNDDD